MRTFFTLCLALLLLLSGCAASEPERYLFYLHGQIVEGSDGRPEHPEFGVYDYPAIIAALEQQGFTVISEIREHNTDGMAYARKLSDQVAKMVDDGVPPESITIAGASKGGGIAVAASSMLANEQLNFVFMGTCVNWIHDWPALELRGRVLSIVDDSDSIAGSCLEPFENSDILPLFKERTINTGRGHGAFYKPLPEWVDLLVDWSKAEGN